jgi:AraC family transcriptional regulator, arabinose operon regulatory protein
MTHKAEGFSGQRIVVLPRAVVTAALKQILLRDLLPTDAGFFPKADGHFMKRDSGVDQAILIYCLKGHGWCDISGTHHKIRPGELLVVKPGTPHAYGADDNHPWTIFWVHVKGENCGLLLDEIEALKSQPVLWLGESPRLFVLFEELLEAMEHGYAVSRLLYASQILTHLVGLVIWTYHSGSDRNVTAAQKVTQSITYMKQHLDQPATVASFAALANLSEPYYRSLFRRQTGYAPMDYFIRLRIHKACQLLDTTPLSIKEIARQVGYQDALYFSHAFKIVMESSPSQYRLQHKG